MNGKKLYKSATDKKISGVCAGIGEYFNVDPTVIRLAWLLLSFTGSGIIAYIVCAIIMPESPYDDYIPPSEGNSN